MTGDESIGVISVSEVPQNLTFLRTRPPRPQQPSFELPFVSFFPIQGQRLTLCYGPSHPCTVLLQEAHVLLPQLSAIARKSFDMVMKEALSSFGII